MKPIVYLCALLAVAALSFPAGVRAEDDDMPRIYQKEGEFVTKPAVLLGGFVVAPVMLVTGSTCTVAGHVVSLFTDIRAWDAVASCTVPVVERAAKVTFSITGAPFYVAKKAFWDLPRRIAGVDRRRRDPDWKTLAALPREAKEPVGGTVPEPSGTRVASAAP